MYSVPFKTDFEEQRFSLARLLVVTEYCTQYPDLDKRSCSGVRSLLALPSAGSSSWTTRRDKHRATSLPRSVKYSVMRSYGDGSEEAPSGPRCSTGTAGHLQLELDLPGCPVLVPCTESSDNPRTASAPVKGLDTLYPKVCLYTKVPNLNNNITTVV